VPYSTKTRLYVIGDIHGRIDLLDRMADLIADDLELGDADSALTVTVGDYLDRGPNAKAVLDRLIRNPFPTDFLALRGNHEELLLTFLRDASTGPLWRQFGGAETLHSYGLASQRVLSDRNYPLLASDLAAAIPQEHLVFLDTLQSSLNIGKFYICHAGVRPGIPLAAQSDDDLLWIRSPFLQTTANFGKIIVHGHTPVKTPEVKPNRLNIDTGAYLTGILSCAVLEGESIRFLATG
jgi:serine/threonine protein phosphatase 1